MWTAMAVERESARRRRSRDKGQRYMCPRVQSKVLHRWMTGNRQRFRARPLRQVVNTQTTLVRGHSHSHWLPQFTIHDNFPSASTTYALPCHFHPICNTSHTHTPAPACRIPRSPPAAPTPPPLRPPARRPRNSTLYITPGATPSRSSSAA